MRYYITRHGKAKRSFSVHRKEKNENRKKKWKESKSSITFKAIWKMEKKLLQQIHA